MDRHLTGRLPSSDRCNWPRFAYRTAIAQLSDQWIIKMRAVQILIIINHWSSNLIWCCCSESFQNLFLQHALSEFSARVCGRRNPNFLDSKVSIVCLLSGASVVYTTEYIQSRALILKNLSFSIEISGCSKWIFKPISLKIILPKSFYQNHFIKIIFSHFGLPTWQVIWTDW